MQQLTCTALLSMSVLTMTAYVGALPFNETHEDHASGAIRETEFTTPDQSFERDLGGRHRILSGSPPVFLLDRFSPVDSILQSPDGKGPYCRRKAKCERLNNTMCLGVKLPYSYTTLDLVGMTQEQVQEKLQFWMALSHVPKCWAVIQPYLCALYMPRCENDQVDLPSQEMCKMALSPCRILELERGWTSPLRCDDSNRFPPMCKNDVRDLRFNTTAQCLSPLVSTDNPSSFYEGVDGCGMQCANPLFNPDEHRQIHELIAYAGVFCFLVNLFTVVSFAIDWRSANKYPALIIFYINCCFMVACIGFLAQFIPGARESIVCRKDGTLRMSEPSAGENLSCVVVFVLIYYFLMAACVWFVILTYAWHLSFRALGKIQERIDKKGAYFHLVAWSLPLVLTITTMALGEIDGNSEMGVCFVGYMNPAARGGLLLGPIAVFYATGGYFLLRGLITLVKVKINSHEIISERASAKIRETIIRMGLFTLFTFVFVVVTFVVHIYEFQHRRSWRESFRTYMTCKIMRSGGVLMDGVGLTGHGDCRMEVRPSLAMVQLHLLALFTAGAVMSSWVWTTSTIHTWTRFIRRSLNQEDDEPIKMKKHKVIAQAFAKRQAFSRAGRISISIHNTHDDPVGLNFELNSAASQDMSSTWAAALPKLVTRRGALIDPATGSISSQYRNSLDSDFSYGVRRVSLESRRQSLDSQLSLALGEFTAARKAASTPVPPPTTALLGGVSSGRVKPRHKRRRREFGRSRVGPLFNRRGSTTSQESQLGAQILSTLAIGNPNIPSLVPNLKRRTGNAGLNDDQILPSTLGQRAILGLHDQSDCSDDDISQACSEALQPAVPVTSSKHQDQKQDEDDVGLIQRNITKEDEKSRQGCREHTRNESPEFPPGGFCKETELNGGKFVKNLGHSKDTYDNEEERELFVTKSRRDSSYKRDTIINQGKKYSKVGMDIQTRLSQSEDESECDSEDEKIKEDKSNVKSCLKEKTQIMNSSREKQEEGKAGDYSEASSDGSSTSYCAELSRLAGRSSLSGLSTGPGKTTTVSALRHAREVGTQTSLAGGLNELDTFEPRITVRSGCAGQMYHDSSTGKPNSGTISGMKHSSLDFSISESGIPLKTVRSRNIDLDHQRSSAECART